MGSQIVHISPEQLVQYITWYASEREEVLNPIRLVKFLYLADLFYARQFQGETLTKWPWRFVHYGPFCGEALAAIENARNLGLIQAFGFESNFDDEEHFIYKCHLDEDHPLHEELPISVTAPLENLIKRFGDDTYQLLDYVYFETEPMQNARYQEVLDFTKAKKVEMVRQIEMKPLSKGKIKKAKEAINKLKANYLSPRENSNVIKPIYDDIYLKALELMDEDDFTELSGCATIIPE